MNSINKDASKVKVSEWKSPTLVSQQKRASNPPGEENPQQVVYERAYKDGVEAGRDAGLLEAREQLKIVHSLLAALSKPFNEQSQQLVESIAQLAGKIAKAVVSKELSTDPEMFIAMVRETVAALNSSQQEVLIHLNPQKSQLIRELMSDESDAQGWKFIDDPNVSIDDCKVRCQDSVIDVNLDARINLIIEQFLENDFSGTGE